MTGKPQPQHLKEHLLVARCVRRGRSRKRDAWRASEISAATNLTIHRVYASLQYLKHKGFVEQPRGKHTNDWAPTGVLKIRGVKVEDNRIVPRLSE